MCVFLVSMPVAPRRRKQNYSERWGAYKQVTHYVGYPTAAVRAWFFERGGP